MASYSISNLRAPSKKMKGDKLREMLLLLLIAVYCQERERERAKHPFSAEYFPTPALDEIFIYTHISDIFINIISSRAPRRIFGSFLRALFSHMDCVAYGDELARN